VTVSGVQARIAHIQALMAATRPAPVAPPAAAGPAPVAASGTSFAAALDEAVGRTTGGAGWVRPTTGSVSSGFGPRWGTMHEGIDLAAASGTPVRAAADGVVKKASWYGGYGNAVILDHGNGVTTLYGHNSTLDVREGQRVSAGEVISRVGSTGDSTGPHLHFEVSRDGEKIDPRPWLKARGVSL
jgi:murein DD-endopeptidase MepM/ murein hydrolase activator NlpD